DVLAGPLCGVFPAREWNPPRHESAEQLGKPRLEEREVAHRILVVAARGVRGADHDLVALHEAAHERGPDRDLRAPSGEAREHEHAIGRERALEHLERDLIAPHGLVDEVRLADERLERLAVGLVDRDIAGAQIPNPPRALALRGGTRIDGHAVALR